MGGVDGHVVFEGGDDGLFHFIGPGETLEGPENDRMVGYYYVAATPHGLGHHGRGAVQCYEYAGYFGLRVTALQAGVVVAFLVGEGRGGFQQAGEVLNGRHFLTGLSFEC